MKRLAVKSLLLMLWLPSMAAQAMTVWEPLGSGNGYFGGDGAAAGGDVIGDAGGFDILNLTASQSGGNLTVNILTNFSEGALLGDSSTSKIVFGDLILATGSDPWHPSTSEVCSGALPGSGINYTCDTASNSGTLWNYVVQTQHPGAMSPGDSVNGSDALYSVASANLLNSNDAGSLQDGVRRDNQYVGLGTGGTDTLKTASETIASVLIAKPADPVNDPSCTINPDVCTNYILGSLLTFNISLADIGILESDYANTSVAIRWTMTCANDIVESSLQLANTVPEPGGLVLFLGGLAGLGLVRRPKRLFVR